MKLQILRARRCPAHARPISRRKSGSVWANSRRDGFLPRQSRRAAAPRIAVGLLFVLTLIALVASPLAAKDGDISVEGLVTTAPGSADGLGLYTLADGAEIYAVLAHSTTVFEDPNKPTVGDRVRVDGQLHEDGHILAERFRLLEDDSDATPEPPETPEPDETPEPTGTPDDDDGDDDGDDDDGDDDGDDDDDGHEYENPCLDLARDRWTGVVTSRPAADAIGEWVLQVDGESTLIVVVTAQTVVDYGIPVVGEWVQVRGRLRDAQTCIVDAQRLRPDEFRGGEIVVRLDSSVAVSQTVAADYGLAATATLLRSGNIFLFTIVDDDFFEDGGFIKGGGDGEEDDGDGEEESIIRQMQTDARIEWAEFNYVNSVPVGEGYKTWGWGGVDPTGYTSQLGLDQVNFPLAQTVYDGDGVVVAVLDTGTDLDHPAFAGRLRAGHDMVDDDAVPQDEGFGVAWGHGTHVSGIVAVAAPRAEILPVRVLDSNGRGNMFTLAYAIEWAVLQGADVINLSIGAESDSRILRDTIQAAVEQGVVVVAAAGNLNDDALLYPAGYADVLSVTAVDGDGVKASFASYGSDWVDIAAPGVAITSTIVGPQGSGYGSWSGTSMAAPFVSAAAAMARQAAPSASPAQITAQLTAAAADLDRLNPAYAGQLGGLLDVAAALGVHEAEAPTSRIFLPVIPVRGQ